ncbi:hypothetical protein [Rhodoblastus sp.]|uniref:hypothetical protein n=1 Tax=Rhodoblastus sp. TaxID=1962975 RepID=UPI003F98E5AB
MPSLDGGEFSALMEMLLAQGAFGESGAGVEEIFADLLATIEDGGTKQAGALFADLIPALDETRIDANGGDRQARKALREIDRMLCEAVAGDILDPGDMMMIGKLFADAGLPPPECLKTAFARAWKEAGPGQGDESAREHGAVLRRQALENGDDPFQIFDFVRSVSCILPVEAKKGIFNHLAEGPATAEAVAGFLLDSDDATAIAAAEALAEAAKMAPVASAALDRLVLIRPWLAPARQAAVDEAIKAMRRNALPAKPATAVKTLKCVATLCDGSGAMQVAVGQKAGTRYRIVAIMIKPTGVADAFVMDDLPKREMDGVIARIKSSVAATETDLEALARLLRLALGDNLASNAPPPFKTAQAVEALGLGPVYPLNETPSELIERLLADAPPQTSGGVSSDAPIEVAGQDITEGWFEGVADVEKLLKPVRGRQKRVKKLLETYLPARRAFWARQCAISALVLRNARDRIYKNWPQLALTGRDLASDRPLTEIPLMTRIAEQTVLAYEQSF